MTFEVDHFFGRFHYLHRLPPSETQAETSSMWTCKVSLWSPLTVWSLRTTAWTSMKTWNLNLFPIQTNLSFGIACTKAQTRHCIKIHWQQIWALFEALLFDFDWARSFICFPKVKLCQKNTRLYYLSTKCIEKLLKLSVLKTFTLSVIPNTTADKKILPSFIVLYSRVMEKEFPCVAYDNLS